MSKERHRQWQNASATQSENRVSIRCDRGQSCRDQANFEWTVPSSTSSSSFT